jgi:hypothetical protein
MKFLRLLLQITKFYGERRQSVGEKLGSAKYCSGNTTVRRKMATSTVREWTQTGYANKH